MQNNTILCNILIFAALAASSTAISKEISYDFIQGSYISTSVDSGTTSGDVDGDGLSVSGSFSVAPHVAIIVGYGATSFDTFQGVDVDATELTFGITAHTMVAERTSVFGGFSVLKGEVEATDGFNDFDDDDTGNIIAIGLRHLATDTVEIDVGLNRVDIFDDTENAFGFGERFYANEKFSLGVGYTSSSDADSLIFNARVDI